MCVQYIYTIHYLYITIFLGITCYVKEVNNILTTPHLKPLTMYSAAWKFVNLYNFLYLCINMNQNIIHTSPASRQREANQTNMRKLFSLSFIYLGKWSNIAYLCMAKVCDSLGLVSFKGEIRVHLCKGVFIQCNDYQMSVHDLFYLKNRDLSKSDHVCGSESCHERDYGGPWKKNWCWLSG